MIKRMKSYFSDLKKRGIKNLSNLEMIIIFCAAIGFGDILRNLTNLEYLFFHIGILFAAGSLALFLVRKMGNKK